MEKPLGSWEKTERVFCKGIELGFPAGMTQSERRLIWEDQHQESAGIVLAGASTVRWAVGNGAGQEGGLDNTGDGDHGVVGCVTPPGVAEKASGQSSAPSPKGGR